MYSPFCYHLLTGKPDFRIDTIVYPLHNRGLNSTEQNGATASTVKDASLIKEKNLFALI